MFRLFIISSSLILSSLLHATTPTYRTFLNQKALAACVESKYGKDWYSLSLSEQQRVQRALNKEPVLVLECELLFATGALQRYNQIMKQTKEEPINN